MVTIDSGGEISLCSAQQGELLVGPPLNAMMGSILWRSNTMPRNCWATKHHTPETLSFVHLCSTSSDLCSPTSSIHWNLESLKLFDFIFQSFTIHSKKKRFTVHRKIKVSQSIIQSAFCPSIQFLFTCFLA